MLAKRVGIGDFAKFACREFGMRNKALIVVYIQSEGKKKKETKRLKRPS